MPRDDLTLAVLIDADNTSYQRLKVVMDEIAVYGTPTIKRIYGDWTSTNLTGWKKPLLEHAITPIQQYAYTTGKNATDSAMIIDAMDILYSDKVSGFCLVSSDSDFTRLAIRLREAGMKVYGLGEKRTPKPFIAACDKFIYIEILGKDSKKPPEKQPEKPTEKPKSLRSKPLVKTEVKAPVPAGRDEPVAPPPADDDRRLTDDIVEVITTAIDDVADDDGWAYLGEVGSLLLKKKPDFDSRVYGFKKLTLLIEAIETVEVDYRQNTIENNGKLIFIRNKR